MVKITLSYPYMLWDFILFQIWNEFYLVFRTLFATWSKVKVIFYIYKISEELKFNQIILKWPDEEVFTWVFHLKVDNSILPKDFTPLINFIWTRCHRPTKVHQVFRLHFYTLKILFRFLLYVFFYWLYKHSVNLKYIFIK